MPLEDIGAVKALLRRRAATWAEAAYHGALIVSKGVPVLVVLPGEALGVVLASGDRALLWALRAVRKHVGLQVLEYASTFWKRALALRHCLVIQVEATAASAPSAGV